MTIQIRDSHHDEPKESGDHVDAYIFVAVMTLS